MAAAGPDKELCGAQRTNQPKGVTCKRVAGAGTDHRGSGRCSRHFGNSPNHKAAADKDRARAEREEARAACERLSLPIADRDPGEVLLDEIARTRRIVYWLETEQALADLAGDGDGSDRRAAQLLEERKHLSTTSRAAIVAGVAVRDLELRENYARQMMALMTAFAVAMGWDPSDKLVREAARQACKALDDGVIDGTATQIASALALMPRAA